MMVELERVELALSGTVTVLCACSLGTAVRFLPCSACGLAGSHRVYIEEQCREGKFAIPAHDAHITTGATHA